MRNSIPSPYDEAFNDFKQRINDEVNHQVDWKRKDIKNLCYYCMASDSKQTADDLNYFASDWLENILYYHKLCLTLEEAAKYTGIGIHKMRALVDRHEDLIFWNGSKRLIKRRKLEEYLEKEYSI